MDGFWDTVLRTVEQSSLIEARAQKQLAEGVLGRQLTDRQFRALEEMRRVVESPTYSAAQMQKLNELITRNGFSQAEILKLRHEGVLNHWSVFWSRPAPTRLHVQEAPLQEISPELLIAVREKKKRFRYLKDGSGQYHLTEAPLNGDLEAFWAARNSTSGSGDLFIVHEAGEFAFDSASGKFTFRPEYALDLDPEETRTALKTLQEKHSDHQFSRLDAPGSADTRVLDCLSLFEKNNQNLKRFVFDRLAMGNAVDFAAFSITDPERLKDGDLIFAEFMGSNVNSAISAAISHTVAGSNLSTAKSLALWTVAGEGFILLQDQFYRRTLDDDEEGTETASSKADALTTYNFVHNHVKIPINYAVDRMLLKKLPNYIFNQCRKGSKLQIYMSPTMVRLYERGASAVFYYGGRAATVGY